MRVSVSIVSLLMLSVVVGCEGNTPRRSPFAAPSTPTAAKTVEFAPVSKSAGAGMQPANPAVPANQPAANNPAPAANGPITIDANKLEARRQLLNFHTAIFLKKEVGTLTTTGITESNNFVFRTVEGLNKFQITSAIYAKKAENANGKPPQTVEELKNLIGEFMTQLQPNEFYVYDPELVTETGENKDQMLYLQQYP